MVEEKKRMKKRSLELGLDKNLLGHWAQWPHPPDLPFDTAQDPWQPVDLLERVGHPVHGHAQRRKVHQRQFGHLHVLARRRHRVCQAGRVGSGLFDRRLESEAVILDVV